MKKITRDIYNTRFPLVNYDYFNNLNNVEEYLDNYSLYVDLLLKYLIKNTDIKKIDDEIKNCKDYMFDFEPISEKKQDLYQYLCNHELSFFYIRNNIYIERLTEGELLFLNSLKDVDIYNDDIDLFIKNTYKRLIKEDTRNDGKDYIINFGPSDNQRFFSPNNSLVIGARMNEYVKSLDTEEEIDEYYKRLDYFTKQCEKLKKELNEKLNDEVNVIEYGESSIRELEFEEEKKMKK